MRQQRLRELSAIGRRGNLRLCAEYQLFAVMPLFPRSGFTRRQAAMRTDHPQRGNRFEALCGMRQHVCGGQQPGEILSRLRGKDTPQTESGKREKQAFTDKNNYIASTANEYPFARNARASHRERGHFACWDSPKPLKIEKGRDETICRILHTTMTNWKPPKPCG